MSEISFLGCGKMGSAMIRVLAAGGKNLTIWNRAPEKARALAQSNIIVAESVGAAIEASPIIIISILEYAPAKAFLKEQESKLRGKTVVQLSNGKPWEARELHHIVTSSGAAYIDGAVGGYPSQIGTPELQILYSGSRSAFDDNKSVLKLLGGTVFVDENPGFASTLANASLFAVIPMIVGLCQGVKFCHAENFPLESYENFIKQVIPVVVDDTLKKTNDEGFASDPKRVQATLTQVVLEARQFVELCREIGTDPGMFEALEALWTRGVANGRGDHDWTCSADL